jgi:hypothetical protein
MHGWFCSRRSFCQRKILFSTAQLENMIFPGTLLPVSKPYFSCVTDPEEQVEAVFDILF